MDILTLSGIKLACRIGTYPWEKQCRQNITFDISLQTDAELIAQSDDLNQAINYEQLVHHLTEYAENKQHELIETFAHNIAQSILSEFATQWVKLTLHKPGALLEAKDVTITVERHQTQTT